MSTSAGTTLATTKSTSTTSLIRSAITPTITWLNPSGGDWSNPANWSGDRIPTSSDDVSINVTGNVTITFSQGTATVHSLYSADAFTLSGGTLTVATTVQVDNTFTLAGGTLSSATVLPGAGGQGLIAAENASNVLSGVTINGTLDLSQQFGAFVRIYNGLTLNGTLLMGNAAGTTFGEITFGNASNAAGSLTGTGTVLFGAANSNQVNNESGETGAAGALTIGAGITVHGDNGYIQNGNDNTSVVNQGTINADVSGGTLYIYAPYGTQSGPNISGTGTIEATAGTLVVSGLTNTNGASASGGGTLILNGTWSNDGTLTAGAASTVNLGGIFTLNASAVFTGTGTYNLTGTLNNSGTTLTLSGPGNFLLNGGTINGGTVNASAMPLIVTSNSGNVLSGVTIGGTLDLSQQFGAFVQTYNGLILNGTLLLGNATGTDFGRITFGYASNASGSLSGTGTVLFGARNSNRLDNESGATGAAGTLTIGSGITIHGDNGEIEDDNSNDSIVNLGVINADVSGGTIYVDASSGAQSAPNISGSGTFEATAGTLSVSGLTNTSVASATGGGTLILNGTWSNYGTLTAGTGSTVTLGGTFSINSRAVFTGTGTFNLTGSLNNTGTTLTPSGNFTLNGGAIIGGTVNASVMPLAAAGFDNVLNGVIVDGTLNLSQQNLAEVTIDNGLTINGIIVLGNAASTTHGRLYFGDANDAAGSLVGTGTVLFGANGSVLGQSGIINQSGETGAAGTLTIGPGILIHGDYGYIQNDNANNSIVNQGTINADVSGGTLDIEAPSGTQSAPNISGSGTIEATAGTLSVSGLTNTSVASATGGGTLILNGTWSNYGTLTAGTGSTVTLGGTFSINSSAVFTGTGTFNLTGSLNNTGTTLTPSGNFTLNGGTIIGGTVNASAMPLAAAGFGNVLNGVTVDGTLDLSQQTLALVTIDNGLTINGSILMGNAAGTTFGRLYFGDANDAAGSLTGTGTVLFGTENGTLNVGGLLNVSGETGVGGTLTIGPGITIRGDNGYLQNDNAHDSTINQGTINADVSGGTLTIFGNMLTNQGTLEAANGGKLVFSNATAQLTNLSSGTLTGGNYDVYANSTINFGTGAITTNAANTLVTGAGASFLGLQSLAGNSGSLTVSSGAQLTDSSPLTNTGTLSIGANATLSSPTLTLNGGTTTMSPSANVIVGALDIDNAATLSVSRSLYMGAKPASLPAGSLVVTGSGTVAPSVTLAADANSPGTLQLGGSVVVSAGTGAVIGTTTVGSGQLPGTIDLEGNLSNFNVTGAAYVAGQTQPDLSIPALVTDGGIDKTGSGTLALSNAANAFTGGVTAIGGTVVLANPSSFTGGVAALSNGPLAGTISVASDLYLGASSNAISLQGGTLDATGSFATSRSIVVGDANGNGNGKIAVSAGDTLTLHDAITGKAGLISAGPGTLQFSAPAQYSGQTQITGGTMLLGAGANLSQSYVTTVGSGATLNLGNQSRNIQALTGSGAVTLGAGTLTIADPGSANATIFSGTIAGSGGVTRTGPGSLTLSGSNSFTGGLAAAGGATIYLTTPAAFKGGVTAGAGSTVVAASDAALGDPSNTITLAGGTLRSTASFTTSRNITVSAAGATIDVPPAMSVADSGMLSGTGNLVLGGSGTLRLTDADALNGSVALRGGTLALSGAGTLSSVSSFNLSAGSTLLFDDSTPSGGNAPAGSRLSATSTITSGGGQIQLLGASSASSAESLGTLTLLPGQTSVRVTDGAGSGSTAKLAFASLIHRVGSQLIFSTGDGTTLGGTDQVTLGSSPPGLMPAWVRLSSGASLASAVYNATVGVEP